MSIAANLKEINSRIHKAAEAAGRKPEAVKLITVTKTVAVERIEEALTCGVKAVGENRVQEAKSKYPCLPNDLEWHLIGSLQTNKVKDVIPIFSWIHSVDRKNLADEISRHCLKAGKTIKVLVQVNISGEASKHGIDNEAAEDLILYVSRLPGLDLRGLMTIGPLAAEEDEIRQAFRGLKNLADKMNRQYDLNLQELSMGMTDDFEIAIAEGATMVRIGSGIFGARY